MSSVGTAGDFVVVWGGVQSGPVFGQRFSSDGTPQGSEFRVNTFVGSAQRSPAVSGIGTSGSFVVAWQSRYQDGGGNNYSVFGQRFASDGTAQGSEFQVNSYTTDEQYRPSVSGVGTAGDFVVAWQSAFQDGSNFGIFGQRFGSTGTPQGSEFQVNSHTMGDQSMASVSGVGVAGDFVVAWKRSADGDNFGGFGQRFGSDGTPQGSEFQVNTFTMERAAQPLSDGVGYGRGFRRSLVPLPGWEHHRRARPALRPTRNRDRHCSELHKRGVGYRIGAAHSCRARPWLVGDVRREALAGRWLYVPGDDRIEHAEPVGVARSVFLDAERELRGGGLHRAGDVARSGGHDQRQRDVRHRVGKGSPSFACLPTCSAPPGTGSR